MTHSGDPEVWSEFLSTVYMPNEGFATSPTTGYTNGTVITNPRNENRIIRLKSVILAVYQAAIDATDPITVALKTVTGAGVAVATLVAAASIKSTAVADKSSVELWRGSSELASGSSLEFETTVTTPDTAGFGYTLTTQGEIKQA